MTIIMMVVILIPIPLLLVRGPGGACLGASDRSGARGRASPQKGTKEVGHLQMESGGILGVGSCV